ncbi:putative eka-like protein [Erysiphe necator]|uniref:Putative eka-like protein n=1 Tax=Uncinula necator TaxID=52586 RepID=A0A0B1PC32_UNCNE|nr:putative eka-like protein [Erysiphe necator]
MVDTEVDKIITQGLNDSRWARPIQDKDSENNSQISQNLQNKIAAGSAGQVKGLSKLTQQPNRSIPTLSTKPNTEVPSPQTAFQNTEIENTRFEEVVGKMSVPQELQEMIEAEIRRAAQAKANIQICTTAINAVEDSLSPMLTGGNKSFVDSLRVFLRASIAQFLQVGPGAAPPKLPMVPPRTLLTAAKTHEDSFPSLGPKTCAIAPAQQEPREQRQDGSWVTVLKGAGNLKS